MIVLVWASYTPSHEHMNALLFVGHRPTVDCCAVQILRTFVEGPVSLTDFDDVGEADRCIVRQY